MFDYAGGPVTRPPVYPKPEPTKPVDMNPLSGAGGTNTATPTPPVNPLIAKQERMRNWLTQHQQNPRLRQQHGPQTHGPNGPLRKPPFTGYEPVPGSAPYAPGPGAFNAANPAGTG